MGAYAGALLRARDNDRFLAIQFAPPGRRADLAAIFALDIELGRIEGLVTGPLTGELRLTWWREALARTAPGQTTGNPVADGVARAIADHGLALRPIEAMIEARRLDLYNEPVASLDDLTSYFADTAGAALDLACRVLEPAPSERTAVCAQAGLVLGVTRMAGHLASARMRTASRLVPVDMLAKLAGGQALMHRNMSPEFQDILIGELVVLARSALDGLQSHLEKLPGALLPVFLPLVLVAGDLARYSRCSAATGKFVTGLARYRRVTGLLSHGLRGRLV